MAAKPLSVSPPLPSLYREKSSTVRVAGGHTSGWILCITSDFYAESMKGRLFPHTLEINTILKQSKPASVEEVPYNMLVIVLQFFCLFLFFSLKSIDRHKN